MISAPWYEGRPDNPSPILTRPGACPTLGAGRRPASASESRSPPLSKAIRAVTIDLWDTIIDDDSDEPKRKAKGLRTKAEERRHLVWAALDRHGLLLRRLRASTPRH